MSLKQGDATYMKDRSMLQINGNQSLEYGTNLWVLLICECDLYAKIYGSSSLLLMPKDAYSPSSHLDAQSLGAPDIGSTEFCCDT